MSVIDVFKLTRDLIEIPSVTGEERDVGRFLIELLEQLGYQVELQQVTSDRANVFATTGAQPRLVLSTHMDTVPPFIALREDEEFIYGRGACDAKGIIAAQIAATEELRAHGIDEIGLLFTVDEESSSTGAKLANEQSAAGLCNYLVNGEPTDNLLAVGSKGSLQVNLAAEGRAAHSAYPEQGESAIEKLLDVLSDIRRIVWPSDEFFGKTTCNIGVISGGVRSNVIPAEARAVLQIRLAVGTDKVRALIERAVNGRVKLEFHSAHDPQRMYAIDGIEHTVVRFTTDIPYLTNWGHPLLIGPGSILDAHTAHERVAKDELMSAVRIYSNLARRLLANAEGAVA